MLDPQTYQARLEKMVADEIKALVPAPGMKLPKTKSSIETIEAAAHRGYTRFYEWLTPSEIVELGVRHPSAVSPHEIVVID